MFYKAEDITELFKCPLCSNDINEPRVLECGDTLCTGCIKSLSTKNGLRCPVCNELTKVSLNKLPTNKVLVELMTKKSENPFRDDERIKHFTQQTEIFDYIKELKDQIKISSKKTKEHCEFLRQNVNVVKDTIKSIIDTANSVIDKTNLSSNAAALKIDENEIFYANLKKCLNILSTFREKWVDYMDKYDLETETEQISKEINDCLFKIEWELYRLNEKIIQCYETKIKSSLNDIKSSLIGDKFEKKDYLNEKFSNLKEISLNLNDYARNNIIDADLKDDGSILICYQSIKNGLYLSIINSNDELIEKNYNFLDNKFFYDIKLIHNETYSYAYISFYGSYPNFENKHETNHYYLIRRISKSLETEKEISIGSIVVSLSAWEDRLFCLTKHVFDYNKIFIYDKDLNHLEIIGENNPKLAFFFPDTITHIEVYNNYLLTLDNNTVKVLYLNNASKVNEFEIVSSNFRLYNQKYIICFNPREHELVYYDFNGYIIYKNTVNKSIDNGLKLLTNSLDGILLFDTRNLIFY